MGQCGRRQQKVIQIYKTVIKHMLKAALKSMLLVRYWVLYRAKQDGPVVVGWRHPWDRHDDHGHCMTTAVAQYPVGEIPDGLRKWAAENKFLLMTRRSKLLSFLGLPTVRSINTISSLRMKTAHNTRQGECFWVKVDKLVSLHTSFGLACWCDNDKLKKEIKYSANIEFLYFEELTDNEKEMLTS